MRSPHAEGRVAAMFTIQNSGGQRRIMLLVLCDGGRHSDLKPGITDIAAGEIGVGQYQF